MIFLTVGTQFPFDRLVKTIDQAAGQGLIQEEIIAQIGQSRYRPHHFAAVPSMDKARFDECLLQADAVIGHAGMGTITMALDHRKPLLVLPRRARYGEVVNDHQVAIARKFAQLGHLLAAFDEQQLPDQIAQLRTFTPKPRQSEAHQVTQYLARFLRETLNGRSVHSPSQA